jgi:phosphomannomutase
MIEAVASGARAVVGYEANGGFLTASPVELAGGTLPPLPTRDPVIVHLGILGLAKARGVPVSRLIGELPARFTASDRVRDFPTERSRERIAALVEGGHAAMEAAFPTFGPVASTDTTDGLRMTFESGEILHLRPSGNAPELRCYAEADTEITRLALGVLTTWR